MIAKNGFCSDNAAVAQSVERRIGSAEVTGPIPVSSLHVRLKPCKSKGKSQNQVYLSFDFFLLVYRAQPVTETMHSKVEVARQKP